MCRIRFRAHDGAGSDVLLPDPRDLLFDRPPLPGFLFLFPATLFFGHPREVIFPLAADLSFQPLDLRVGSVEEAGPFVLKLGKVAPKKAPAKKAAAKKAREFLEQLTGQKA